MALAGHGLRVAVVPISAVGHVNPMLAVTAALVAHREVTHVRSFGPAELGECFRATGATHSTGACASPVSPPEIMPPLPDLLRKSFVEPIADIYETVRRVRDFAPDVVLYDVFSAYGLIAVRALGRPSASLVTFPGYGALGDSFVEQYSVAHPSLRWANERYKQLFGLDLLGEGILPVLFPSPDLSIVTTIESLSVQARRNDNPRLYDLLTGRSRTSFVGPCIGSVRMIPPAKAGDSSGGEFPFAALDEAKRRGRHVVLFSLGTVITDFRFGTPVGGAPSGRAFLLRALGWLIEGFADDPTFTVVVATGQRLARLCPPRWPANFSVRAFVPQVEVLERYADVFITHHGANSTIESLFAGVPMVSLPGVGDQLAGAALMLRAGAAVASWDLSDPFSTCSADRLRDAVRRAVEDERYRRRCGELGEEMRRAGGAPDAAQCVVSLAREWSTRPRARMA